MLRTVKFVKRILKLLNQFFMYEILCCKKIFCFLTKRFKTYVTITVNKMIEATSHFVKNNIPLRNFSKLILTD